MGQHDRTYPISELSRRDVPNSQEAIASVVSVIVVPKGAFGDSVGVMRHNGTEATDMVP